MMRSHGIAPNAASIKPAPSSRPLKSEPRDFGASSSTASKKRKMDSFLNDNTGEDDEGFGNIVKPDPADMKEHFVVKEESESQQIQKEGQLSLSDAASLMRYYDAPTSFSATEMSMNQEGYSSSQYEGSAGYHTPLGSSYSMSSQPTYGFSPQYRSNGYASTGVGDDTKPEISAINYQSMMQYPPDDQGRSDSPVIVE
jgi:hypothetical protein